MGALLFYMLKYVVKCVLLLGSQGEHNKGFYQTSIRFRFSLPQLITE